MNGEREVFVFDNKYFALNFIRSLQTGPLRKRKNQNDMIATTSFDISGLFWCQCTRGAQIQQQQNIKQFSPNLSGIFPAFLVSSVSFPFVLLLVSGYIRLCGVCHHLCCTHSFFCRDTMRKTEEKKKNNWKNDSSLSILCDVGYTSC